MMAKGILKFKLPEEQSEYLNAVYGSRFASTIETIDERLRTLLKHGDIEKTTSEKLAEEIRAMLREDLALLHGW
jgi:hypothetical protein